MKTFLIMLLLLLIAFCLQAQQSEPGLVHNNIDYSQPFWTVETTKEKDRYSIIRFYQYGIMIYEERLEYVYLDIRKPKVKRMLNRSLKMYTDRQLISLQLKGYREVITSNLYKKAKP